jgi:mannosyltransferase
MAAAPTLAHPPSGSREIGTRNPSAYLTRTGRWGAVAVVAVLAAGIALRLTTRSALWLDEALTVNVAHLPLRELHGALRQDGAPPLYYLLLHGWMEVFGTGNLAARSLSAVFGVATLPLMAKAGRRLGGPVVGLGALVLLAASPFAIRYATEARMYTLVALIVTAGWLVLRRVLDRPRPFDLVALAALSGALLLTHYWGFYLIGVVAVALAVKKQWAALAAIVLGAVVLFAPWLPTFLYQRAHTGTPWGTAPGPVEVAFTTLVDLGGGPYPEGQALAGVLAALVLLGLAGRAVDGRRIELDLRTRPGVRPEFVIGAVALLIAVAVGTATGSAFASRYTSVAFPLLILTAAFGLRSFADRRVVALVLAITSVLGLVGGVRNAVYQRTQAPAVAAAIEANGGQPGDVVVYCPDQLGPDVSRLLPSGYQQATFPDLADPHIVNWADYGTRMAAADPAAFAAEIQRRAVGRNIWYVWMSGYRTLDKQCERLNDALASGRPGNRQLLDPDKSVFERQVLWLHPPA